MASNIRRHRSHIKTRKNKKVSETVKRQSKLIWLEKRNPVLRDHHPSWIHYSFAICVKLLTEKNFSPTMRVGRVNDNDIEALVCMCDKICPIANHQTKTPPRVIENWFGKLGKITFCNFNNARVNFNLHNPFHFTMLQDLPSDSTVPSSNNKNSFRPL